MIQVVKIISRSGSGRKARDSMENRYLFRGKRIDNGGWEIGSLIALPDGKFEIANKCENPPDSDPMWGKCVITHYVDRKADLGE